MFLEDLIWPDTRVLLNRMSGAVYMYVRPAITQYVNQALLPMQLRKNQIWIYQRSFAQAWRQIAAQNRNSRPYIYSQTKTGSSQYKRDSKFYKHEDVNRLLTVK